MIQKVFAETAVSILSQDENVMGIAVGGSWLFNELDGKATWNVKAEDKVMGYLRYIQNQDTANPCL